MTEPKPIDTTRIVFYSDRRPVLKDGDYTITVNQTLPTELGAEQFEPVTQSLSVLGPRFTLDTSLVHSKFPPDGSLGAYDNVLPHIMLDRCTLPWERSPQASLGQDAASPHSWLAVVVLDETEFQSSGNFNPNLASVRIAEMAGNQSTHLVAPLDLGAKEYFPPLKAEVGDKGSDGKEPQARLLCLPRQIASTVLPTAEDLAQVAHVRSTQPNAIFDLAVGSSQSTKWELVAGNVFAAFVPVTGVDVAAPLKCSITPPLPDGLKFDEHTGAIAGKPAAAMLATTYTITVVGTQPGTSDPLTKAYPFSLAVRPEPAARPTLAPGSVDATTGIAYAKLVSGGKTAPFSPVTCTGGPQSYQIEPDLPTGLLFDTATGAITGTPSAASEVATYTISAVETFAVVIANRLPRAGAKSHAFLVSLEGHYLDGELIVPNGSDSRLLVVLASWRFTCASDLHDFAGLLKNLSIHPLRMPLATDFTERRQPASIAQQWLAGGSAGLVHSMRQGNFAVSWYRGPLLPGAPPAGFDSFVTHTNSPLAGRLSPADGNMPAAGTRTLNDAKVEFAADGSFIFSADAKFAGTIKVPTVSGRTVSVTVARNPDALARLDRSLGLYDMSYSTAFELGRQLMLADTRCSRDLYHWKRAVARHGKSLEAMVPGRLGPRTPDAPPSRPRSLDTWVDHLALLKGLPFGHLVADERMLPRESIRFFHIDPVWMDCLFAGAFSIGFVPAGNARPAFPCWSVAGSRRISGFLLRSSVVSGWPELAITGYGEAPPDNGLEKDVPSPPLSVLRLEHLSMNVLIVLFMGTLRTLDVNLPPARVHFGLDKNGQIDPAKFTKRLRATDGTLRDSQVPGQVKADNRVVGLGALAKNIEDNLKQSLALQSSANFTPALFAMEMIEGAERVRFLLMSPK